MKARIAGEAETGGIGNDGCTGVTRSSDNARFECDKPAIYWPLPFIDTFLTDEIRQAGMASPRNRLMIC